jgi:hypothetical protein
MKEQKSKERPHADRRRAAQKFYRAWEAKGFCDYFESDGFRISAVSKEPTEWVDPRDYDRET